MIKARLGATLLLLVACSAGASTSVEEFPGWQITRASGYTAVLERREGVDFTLAVPDELLELTTRVALVPNVEWAAPDRGVISFRDLDDVAAREAAVVDLVRRWMSA